MNADYPPICPPSPASSTLGTPEPIQHGPLKPPPIDHFAPFSSSPNSNVNANPAPSSSAAGYGFSPDDTFSEYSAPYLNRRSPPPEPKYPQSEPGQQPATALGFTYVPSNRLGSPPPERPPPTAQPTWPPHSPPSADDPNAQIDQLFDQDDNPTSSSALEPSPPQSPQPGSSGSITLQPLYHPHHQYPISPPGADQHTSRTYSFVSLPGNAMRKRPRRRYDEIERLYRCNWDGCTKSYGTLNHLNAHVSMQRHGVKRTPGEFKEMRKLWRKQKREAEQQAEHHAEAEEADLDDLPTAPGPSTSPSARSRRRRRATEPNLPNIVTSDEHRDDNYARTPQGLDMSRRVSMDDYLGADRRGSGGSGDGDTTQGDDASDDAGVGPSGTQVGPPQSAAIPGAGAIPTGEPGLHSASATSPDMQPPPSLPPMSIDTPPSVSFWQSQSTPQPQSQAQASAHQTPISPTTVVAPHVSHLPGPGPMPMPLHGPSHAPSSHQRHLSYPPGSYAPAPSQPMMHASYSSVPLPPPHHPTMSYPPQPPAAQPRTPPQPSYPTHVPGQQPQPHMQHVMPMQTGSPQSQPPPPQQQQHLPPHHYTASPPPVQRLHPGSMLLTPLSQGHPHRHTSADTTSPPTLPPTLYPSGPVGSSSGPSQQGLPPLMQLAPLARHTAEEELQPQQAPVSHLQQPSPHHSWETYPPAGPHRPADPYSVGPSPLGRPAAGYDPNRDYHPGASGSDSYASQRNDSYAPATQAPPQRASDVHPHSYLPPQPQRAPVAYPSNTPESYISHQRADQAYMAPGMENYVSGRRAVPSQARSDAGQYQAPHHGRQEYVGRSEDYPNLPALAAHGHVPPHHAHHLPPPSHTPQGDPRGEHYGQRGHPGPSEGGYQ
ncbi:hypothetical protein FRB99_004578 [Tulasnella sp. 403]|nr:hypothetical protein FRB99_004578 [Tulasnella sp. 403]